MQPCSREMQSGSGGGGVGMNSLLNHPTASSSSSQISLQDLQHNPHQIQANHHHFDGSSSSSHDDFLEQMLSTLGAPPSWPDLSAAAAAAKAPWDSLPLKPQDDDAAAFPNYDDSINLATKFRNHQISSSGAGAATKSATFTAAMMLQHQLMMARGGAGGSSMPLSLNGEFDRSHQNDIVDGSPFKSPGSDGPVQALYNGFGAGSLPSPNQFHHPQGGSMQAQPNYGAPSAAAAMNQTPAPSGAQPAQPRPRIRARRGQATDPHSIAERLRRERIAERMKALQELVPNANKTDKASMLDEIIDYVKFLQLQVKVLSMSRLGGAAAVAPLVADMSSEGGGDCIQTSGSKGGAHGRTSSNGNGNGNNQTGSSNDTMTVTEHQVAKLMEEDMGSAMQYLQGKGLCLMPISLATAISTATCHSRSPLINHHHPNPMMAGGASNGAGAGDGPTSPSMSVLTVQSATAGNGVADGSVKDNASVSKP